MLGHKRIPSREGGVEVVVEELATRMAKKDLTVVCYNRRGKHVLDKNHKIEKLSNYKGVVLKTVPTFDKKGLAAVTSSFFATIKILFSNADIVHYHAEGPCFWLWIIKFFSKKAIVVTIHGLDWKRDKWGKFAAKYIKTGEKIAAKFSNEIIVLSKEVQKYFEDNYGRKTVYISNGVNKPLKEKPNLILNKYNLKKDSYILFLGRVVPEKGVHYLIDAFGKLRTNKKLVIAGAASDSSEYYEILKNKSVNNDNIIFTGFVHGVELAELYSNAYIYCLPSNLEGMPLSLLEAMSYGNCCVTSDIDECASVIEDKGIVFEKSNVDDLAKILQKLCDNKSIVDKYKEQSQDYILNKYDWDKVVDKTIDIYKKWVNK